MGAWGAGNFENDTALDWVWELEAADDLGPVEAALADVLVAADEGDLDADVGSIGLAAAEVVAALGGRPLDGLPEEVAAWVQAHPFEPVADLVRDGLAAVARIRDDEASELRELWAEEEELLAEWHVVVDDLVARLR